jgi:all-trans-8'-apo-beta-carotenal 15,15'-oxygenase
MNAEAKLLDVAQRRCDFHRGFLALQEEHCGWVNNIRGNIPEELSGTLFRNGPGAMNAGSEAYGHWFDGPGMVSAVTFCEGKAHFKNRYVRTPKFLSDQQQGRVSRRGFGTQIRGGLVSNLFKPLANPATPASPGMERNSAPSTRGASPFGWIPSRWTRRGPSFTGKP